MKSCKIQTLDDLCDYLNSNRDANWLLVQEVIEKNGWRNLCDNEFDVCADESDKITIDEDGEFNVVAL